MLKTYSDAPVSGRVVFVGAFASGLAASVPSSLKMRVPRRCHLRLHLRPGPARRPCNNRPGRWRSRGTLVPCKCSCEGFLVLARRDDAVWQAPHLRRSNGAFEGASHENNLQPGARGGTPRFANLPPGARGGTPRMKTIRGQKDPQIPVDLGDGALVRQDRQASKRRRRI